MGATLLNSRLLSAARHLAEQVLAPVRRCSSGPPQTAQPQNSRRSPALMSKGILVRSRLQRADRVVCANWRTSQTQDEAADLLNVARRSVQRARVVLDRGVPELVAAVQEGKLASAKVAEIAGFDPERQRRVNGTLSMAQARAASDPKDIGCEDQTPTVMSAAEFDLALLQNYLAADTTLQPRQAAQAVPADHRNEIISLAQRRHRWLASFLEALEGDP